jgi:Mg2+ and Co2+ transporter CorA
LEDILHKETREKLELFPGLGYYFIIFRALEGEKSRQRFKYSKANGYEVPDASSGDEGVIGAVNVYLVVFREGILSVSISILAKSLIARLVETYSFSFTSKIFRDTLSAFGQKCSSSRIHI